MEKSIGIAELSMFELTTLVGVLCARVALDEDTGRVDNEIHTALVKLLKLFDDMLKEETGSSFVEFYNSQRHTDAQV